MSQLKDRLERDLREIAAGAHPSPTAWQSIVARLGTEEEAEVAFVVAPTVGRAKRPVWIAAAAAAVVVIIVSIAVLATRGDDHSTTISDPDRTTILPTVLPFVGVWLATDFDGSSQTMEITRFSEDDYEFVLRDDLATTCAGSPATMTGTGQLETDTRLVIAQPSLTCDDGTTPSIGAAPQAELANYAFDLDPADDEILDPSGIVWRREGSNEETVEPSVVTVPALATGTSGGMWPQSTLAEVRAAQELADAGDPNYTWQLDADLAAYKDEPYGAEIFARFIEDELGWDQFASGSSFAGYLVADGGDYAGVVFIRCAPGQTNPLNPLYSDAPLEIRGCAPTIDDFTYETVKIDVRQPDRRGASGIWVVERWEIPQQSAPDPASLWQLLVPDQFSLGQVEQFVPPSDAAVTALLQDFLQARIDGEGADQYLLREADGSPFNDMEAPLLYATTSAASYERSEIERVRGPVWPNGNTEYKIRLFAEDETVVEQYFHVVRDENGRLGLLYGYASSDVPTTENGQSVAVPFSEFGDSVTFIATPPLVPRGDGSIEIELSATSNGRIRIAIDPRPDGQGCENGSVPADAQALALSIMADPNFETTEPMQVPIAGIDGLQMDLAFSEQNLCYELWPENRLPAGDPGWRMRLYLISYPDELASPSGSKWGTQVLTIAVIAPATDFERVLEEATPIVESIMESLEFHAPS